MLRSKTYRDDIPAAESTWQRRHSLGLLAILVVAIALSFLNPDVAMVSLNALWITGLIDRGH